MQYFNSSIGYISIFIDILKSEVVGIEVIDKHKFILENGVLCIYNNAMDILRVSIGYDNNISHYEIDSQSFKNIYVSSADLDLIIDKKCFKLSNRTHVINKGEEELPFDFKNYTAIINIKEGGISILCNQTKKLLMKFLWICTSTPYLEGAFGSNYKKLDFKVINNHIFISQELEDFLVIREYVFLDNEIRIITKAVIKRRISSIKFFGQIWTPAKSLKYPVKLDFLDYPFWNIDGEETIKCDVLEIDGYFINISSDREMLFNLPTIGVFMRNDVDSFCVNEEVVLENMIIEINN